MTALNSAVVDKSSYGRSPSTPLPGCPGKYTAREGGLIFLFGGGPIRPDHLWAFYVASLYPLLVNLDSLAQGTLLEPVSYLFEHRDCRAYAEIGLGC